jgi:hypothetical protein
VTTKESVMQRPVALPVLAFSLLGLFVLGFHPVIAQDATPVPTGDHPIIGAWWSFNDAPGTGLNTAVPVFHADGTYLEADPNIGVGVGVWRPTGARSAELIAVYQDIDPDPVAVGQGTVTVRSAVEVDETGDAFTSTLTIEVRIPDGTLVFSDRYEGGGTRLEIGSVVPLGTPVAGTPVP